MDLLRDILPGLGGSPAAVAAVAAAVAVVGVAGDLGASIRRTNGRRRKRLH